MKNSNSKLKNCLQPNSLFSRWGNCGREYLVRLRPPSHMPRETKLFGGSGEAWWERGKGAISFQTVAWRWRLAQMKYFIILVQGESIRESWSYRFQEFLSWKGWWRCLLSLYTKIRYRAQFPVLSSLTYHFRNEKRDTMHKVGRWISDAGSSTEGRRVRQIRANTSNSHLHSASVLGSNREWWGLWWRI